jgi:hypothetical protein
MAYNFKRSVDLLRALVDKAYWHNMLSADGDRNGKVGQFINRLDESDREILKELKSDDIAKDRWPPFDTKR